MRRLISFIEPVLIMAISAALIVSLYNFYLLVNQQTETGIKEHLTDLTLKNSNFVRQKINSDLNTIYMLSNYISTFDNMIGDEVKQEINRVFIDMPFSVLIVRTNNGTYICSNNANINLDDPSYFLNPVNQDKTVSAIYKDALYGRDMLALTSPIYQKGQIVGSVSGLYYTDYIKNVLDDVLNANSFLQIIEKNGNFILFSDSENYLGQSNIYSLLGESKMKKGYSIDSVIFDIQKTKAGFAHFEYENHDIFLSYAPIGINDWYLLSITQKESLIDPNDIQSSTIILASRIMVIFALLLAYIIWRQLKYRRVMEENNANLKIINKRLKIEARIDLMTGLYNKVSSETMIAEFLEGEGKGGKHAFFILDVDNFKSINDEIGHLSGDRVLIEAANGIEHQFRTTDIKGRIGGDEFTILLKDIQSESDILKKAEGICSIFKDIKIIDGYEMRISGSVGISIYPDHGTTYQELFKKADIAMYEAKDRGKSCYSIYSKEMEFDTFKTIQKETTI